jgi:hypothetical protein
MHPSTAVAAFPNLPILDSWGYRKMASPLYGSMSIASFGPSTLPDAKRTTGRFAIKTLTDNSDIDGSYHTNKYDSFCNKYHKFQQDEVIGNRSAARTWTRNTADLQLQVDDIEGARVVRAKGIYNTNRHINPLGPEYVLPTYAKAEAPVVPLRRDALDHADIAGSNSKPLYKPYMRDIISVSDIDGTNSHWKTRQARLSTGELRIGASSTDYPSSELATQRGVHVPFIKRTSRITDPLVPLYEMHGSSIGDDSTYFKPRRAKEGIVDNHLLMTEDIAGASATWRKEQMSKRRDFTQTNFNLDIKGAQHDTIVHSIKSTRDTNPLQPVYQSLDGNGETLVPCVMPLIQPSLVTVPTLRTSKSEVCLPSQSVSGRNTVASRQPGSSGFGDVASNNWSSPSVLSPKYSPKPATGPSVFMASGQSPSSRSFATKFDSSQSGPFGK